MHRSLRVIGVAALVALPAVASAQEPRPVTIGVSGGVSLPMGDLGDGFSTGFNVTGHVGFKPASWTNLMLRGDVSFDQFGAEGGSIAGVEANYRNIGVSGNLVYAFSQSNPSVVRPYVLGGVGVHFAKVDLEGTVGGTTINNDSETDTNVGVQAGAGINFNLAGFTTFLEAKFVNVFRDGNSANWIPVTFGIRF